MIVNGTLTLFLLSSVYTKGALNALFQVDQGYIVTYQNNLTFVKGEKGSAVSVECTPTRISVPRKHHPAILLRKWSYALSNNVPKQANLGEQPIPQNVFRPTDN